MSWQREMDKQGFNPDIHSHREVIDFCERMEATTEDGSKSTKDNNTSNNNNNKKPKTNGHSTGSKTTGKWCDYHKNSTHNTAECRQKKYHDKKGESPKSNTTSGNYKNKTWSRNANNQQAISKQEINAMIVEAISANAAQDKKKRDSEELNNTEQVQDLEILLENVPEQPLSVGDVEEDLDAAVAETMDLDDLDAEFAQFQKANGELV
jgi:hypothetical protein